MSTDSEDRITAAIESAEEIPESASADARGKKPKLLVENCSPDRTVAALRDVLAGAGGLYERGVPVRLAVVLAHADLRVRDCLRWIEHSELKARGQQPAHRAVDCDPSSSRSSRTTSSPRRASW